MEKQMNDTKKQNLPVMLVGTGMLIGGLAIGYIFSEFSGKDPVSTEMAKGDGPCPDGAKALSWRNPMNPAITSPVAAKDEMGMDYLPICGEQEREENPVLSQPDEPGHYLTGCSQR